MHTASEPSVRPPAVAGAFYPETPDALRRTVDSLLGEAHTRLGSHEPIPKAVIAPHAGYVYSGPVAAHAYARLVAARRVVQRVVLLGPAHRVAVRGLALPGAQAFATPLGSIAVDEEAIQALAGLRHVVVSTEAHALEHSLEVQLPFLQVALERFKVVPLLVGDASPEQVAEVLDRLWGGEETLIVVSSDLSHYLTYAQAQATDAGTVRQILGLQPVIDPYQACGAAPLNGLLVAATRRGLGARLLDLRNSGDTAGDGSRVVGYASFAFRADDSAQVDDPGKVLIPIARSAIGGVLGVGFDAPGHHDFLHEHGACFVTLTRHGRLRGCIGSLQAHRKLLDDVKANAVAAAFRDPRFEPLTRAELGTTRVEVSLLSPSEPVSFASEDDALSQLRPGVDGVILEYGACRATFLPQVWEQLPDPARFFSHLKRKAGLPADFWAEDVRLSRYTVTKWRESELDGPA